MNHLAYILLGSNLGDRKHYLEIAVAEINDKCGSIKCLSSIYESPPWGFEAKQNFYNQALLLETVLEPDILLTNLLAIEQKMGRYREGSAYASRVIDIDIMYFDNQVIDSKLLIIPHPRLHLRRFALEPLSEIAPDFVHPLLRLTNLMLLESTKDSSDVIVVNNS